MENKLRIFIATAMSRKAKRWNNETVDWTDLVNRCRTTRRTGETMAQYAAMNRDEQSNRKDVGGFVGGFLADGLRRNGHVTCRSILTLDIDYGDANVWADFCLWFPHCAAFLYSTHKHNGADAHRYRLVVLLSRAVQPWEYEPIARRVAEKVGIEKFDGTTYELPRLFFYPSSSDDAPFVFQEQTGDPLDADAVLASYADPRDAAQWPRAQGEATQMRHIAQKQGEPTLKPGLVGAFCRAYTIDDAIALTQAYVPTAHPDRWTYKNGTVAGGLVTYDAKFAYSHHDSDPASCRLCNAFDLVRIHRFGMKDNCKTFEDITQAPSFKAMVKFAKGDKKVAALLMAEGRGNCQPNSKTMSENDLQAVYQMLDYEKNGKPKVSTSNIQIILENDPNFRGKLYHDDFTGYNYADEDLPWNRYGRMWSDVDDACLRNYIEAMYRIQSANKVYDTLTYVFTKNRRHPVRDYLKALVWDGQPRLDTLIVDYLGAFDSPLNRAMTRKMFVGAVARVMEPGVKFDNCLVLVGGEGIGKSTFLKKMGRKWFSDSIVSMEGKDAMEALRGVWIIELAELSGLKRSEVEQQKQFLSKQVDRYREAYGRNTVEVPRQCVFFASTNEDKFLKGDTGNRRMWVIETDERLRKHANGAFDLTDEYIDQVYAEAFQAYLAHEPLTLNGQLEHESRMRQGEFNVEADDPMPGFLADFLAQPLPSDWYEKDQGGRRRFYLNKAKDQKQGFLRTKFCAAEFLYEFLGIEPKDRNYGYLVRKVNKLVAKLPDWQRKTQWFSKYGTQRGWERDNR